MYVDAQDSPQATEMSHVDPPGGHDIHFDNVTFSYRRDQPILQVIHMALPIVRKGTVC